MVPKGTEACKAFLNGIMEVSLELFHGLYLFQKCVMLTLLVFIHNWQAYSTLYLDLTGLALTYLVEEVACLTIRSFFGS